MKKISLVVAILAILSFGSVLLSPSASYADGDAVVSVTVQADQEIKDLVVDGQSDEATTYNGSITISFNALGAGLVELVDKDDAIILSDTKTTTELKAYSQTISLSEGVGTYTFTARITGANGVSEKDIVVRYSAIPLPGPETPDTSTPNTGYFYIGGYAFAISNVIFDFICIAVIAFVVWFVIARRKQHRKTA